MKFYLFSIFLAVFHAMFHDGSSGGVCRIGIINKDGVERRVFFAPTEDDPVVGTSAAIAVRA